MIPFARNAKWLTHLFTPSVTPTTRFPDRYSREVSLVAPYDGGGWGIPSLEQWATPVNSVAAATADTTILTVPDDSYYRLLSMTAVLTAGAVPAQTQGVVNVPFANATLVITDEVTLVASLRKGLRPITPIIGPGSVIQGSHNSGDVATVIAWSIYGILVPLGTSFTI